MDNLVSKWRSTVKNLEELQINIFSLAGYAINLERQEKSKETLIGKNSSNNFHIGLAEWELSVEHLVLWCFMPMLS